MKNLYWRMYQDKLNVHGRSVIITQEEMMNEIKHAREYYSEDEDFPVFEPVFITEEEFKNLEEFEGF